MLDGSMLLGIVVMSRAVTVLAVPVMSVWPPDDAISTARRKRPPPPVPLMSVPFVPIVSVHVVIVIIGLVRTNVLPPEASWNATVAAQSGMIAIGLVLKYTPLGTEVPFLSVAKYHEAGIL